LFDSSDDESDVNADAGEAGNAEEGTDKKNGARVTTGKKMPPSRAGVPEELNERKKRKAEDGVSLPSPRSSPPRPPTAAMEPPVASAACRLFVLTAEAWSDRVWCFGSGKSDRSRDRSCEQRAKGERKDGDD
jgi:hypothetical protein